ncbi:MAG: hypothetical protein JXK05_10120 [Campylobacterales bacterium]|nr:hypothetical protein [Campylobacterales bacterium]
MKFMPSIFILWASLLLLSGCASKTYGPSQSVLLTLKTPKIKFSDMGYLHFADEGVRLDLYSGGVPVRRIEVGEEICVDEGCMEASRFNAEYLSPAYPPSLLRDVLQGRGIYGGAALLRTQSGFEQHIEGERVRIVYRVDSEGVWFKDEQNAITIRYRRL